MPATASASATSNGAASLTLNGHQAELPIVVGTENEHAVDISKLRDQTGYVTLDDGYGNTGSCASAITYIDGDNGILRYRGIPIEQLAQKSTFLETAWLVIWGELPTRSQLARFEDIVAEHALIHESMRTHFEGFPISSHPMAILGSMISALSCYHPEFLDVDDEESFEVAAARLLSKVRTIVAAAYKMSRGEPSVYPIEGQGYAENFLHMMFTLPHRTYQIHPDVASALNLILVLHADHEQNCSTSTVRMVASSGANLYASCTAGVCALWGPLHGGANQAVIEMLERIRDSKMSVSEYVDKVKKKEEGIRLMGFGHRVYKNFDPRAKIIKAACDKVLNALKITDPLLDLAKELEEAALQDNYFAERKLYPNVDFYSGIIFRAIGIPLNAFTAMFAIGRMPGWIANFRETRLNPRGRIYRPRQIYVGPTRRDYVDIDQRA